MSACFTCKSAPAGHGRHYRFSAYCRGCQPTPDFIKPVGLDSRTWRGIVQEAMALLSAANSSSQKLARAALAGSPNPFLEAA
jgi:hypothetical protein